MEQRTHFMNNPPHVEIIRNEKKCNSRGQSGHQQLQEKVIRGQALFRIGRQNGRQRGEKATLKTARQAGRKAGKKAGRQEDRKTGRQTWRQAEW